MTTSSSMLAAALAVNPHLFDDCKTGDEETYALIRHNAIMASHDPQAFSKIEDKDLFDRAPMSLTADDVVKVNALTRILRAAGLDVTGCYVGETPYNHVGRAASWTVETSAGRGIVMLRRVRGVLLTTVEVVTFANAAKVNGMPIVADGADAEIIKALRAWGRPYVIAANRRNGNQPGFEVTVRCVIQEMLNDAAR